MTREGFFEPFRLERYFARWEFEARWLMCSSDCESVSVRELLDLDPDGERRLLELRLGYTETRGAPSLREAVARGYGTVDADGVLVHAGAEEAILNLGLAALSRGEKVVVNRPCYQSLREIPRALGCELVPWDLREAAGPDGRPRWFLDPDELARKARGARMIVLNAPHNPTGALPTLAEFEAIARVADREGALLLVDEVYRGLEHDPARRLPAACDVSGNGISLGVLSKTYGLAGLRVGWLATRRKDVLDAVAVQKDYNSICSSGPSEVLAEIAVRNAERIAERNRSLVARNLALLDAFLDRRPGFARWTRPEGSSIGFPRLSDGGDAEALAARLVTETGVLLLPGAYYGCDPATFRVGYGRANFPEALGRLESWLDAKQASRQVGQ